MKLRNKLLHFILVLNFSLFFNNLFAQEYNIDYIGIISTEIDQNMSKLTSDLYFTQLNEIHELTVNDKRTGYSLENIPETSELSSENLSFFTEIKKDTESDKWITIYHVFNPLENNENTKIVKYDSFYKILMESKSTLKVTIKNLITNEETEKKDNDNVIFQTLNKIASTEILSGTWSGEEYIDKIIIMRGGRGFIIFNNGASMTIEVSLENIDGNQIVVVKQQGHANASFYPNLPRNIAVKAALSADPLEWSLSLSDNNTLNGTKKALTTNGENFDYVTENVKWKRVR